MSGTDDLDLSQRVARLETTVGNGLQEVRKELTAACQSVRAETHGRITEVERSIAEQMASLRILMQIGLILLACILAFVAWGTLVPATQQIEPLPYDQRIEELTRAVGLLTPDDPDHWTSDGKPRVAILQQILSAQLGYAVRVTPAERDLAVVLAREVSSDRR